LKKLLLILSFVSFSFAYSLTAQSKNITLQNSIYTHTSDDFIGLKLNIPVISSKYYTFNINTGWGEGTIDVNNNYDYSMIKEIKAGVNLEIVPLKYISFYTGINAGHISLNKPLDDTNAKSANSYTGIAGVNILLNYTIIGFSYEYGNAKFNQDNYRVKESSFYIGYYF